MPDRVPNVPRPPEEVKGADSTVGVLATHVDRFASTVETGLRQNDQRINDLAATVTKLEETVNTLYRRIHGEPDAGAPAGMAERISGLEDSLESITMQVQGAARSLKIAAGVLGTLLAAIFGLLIDLARTGVS